MLKPIPAGSVGSVTYARPDSTADWAGIAIFRPVRTGNAFEEAVERILQAVKLGVFPHGSRLPVERDLAVRLNVSRATVRDAIRSLQDAGYVTSRHGRYGGTFVAYQVPEPGPDDLRRAAADISDRLDDAIIYRHVLEAGAAERAALADLGAEQRDYLNSRLIEVASAPPAEYRLADSRFHLAIAELTASRSLTASIAECRMRLNDLLNAIPMLARNIEHASAQHRAIVQAILAGDAVAARQATAEHLDATAALIRGFLG
jgi:GntR family transcriptional regulator, transcriptional repressor for pyruvate dehydrogenase complex